MLIDNGTFVIDAADDAIHSNGNITINGGAFTLNTGDDGLHADATLTINGGNIAIPTSYEGLESAVITINAGDINLTSSDDGINVASGIDGSGQMARPGRGGRGQGGPCAQAGRGGNHHRWGGPYAHPTTAMAIRRGGRGLPRTPQFPFLIPL